MLSINKKKYNAQSCAANSEHENPLESDEYPDLGRILFFFVPGKVWHFETSFSVFN